MSSKYGDRSAAAEGKKHVAWYIKGIKNSASARNNVMNAQTCEEIFECLNLLEKSL